MTDKNPHKTPNTFLETDYNDGMKAVTGSNALNRNPHLTFSETRRWTVEILSCTSYFGKQTKETQEVTMTMTCRWRRMNMWPLKHAVISSISIKEPMITNVTTCGYEKKETAPNLKRGLPCRGHPT